jgi:poly(3-hydroxybutyrate) depolymerase
MIPIKLNSLNPSGGRPGIGVDPSMTTYSSSSRTVRNNRKLGLMLGLTLSAFACSSETGSDSQGGAGGSAANTSSGGTAGASGGSPAMTGGVSSGGASATGGFPGNTGGAATGGVIGTGGLGTGGVATGGQATGGASTGGADQNTGGVATGGRSFGGGGGATATGGRSFGGRGGGTSTGGAGTDTGGTSTGGVATGGTTNGGAAATGGTSNGGAAATGGSTAAGGSSSGQSAGCGKTSTITSSQYNNGNPISITVNGSQRRYILQVPTNYNNTTPYKFILAIHELNGNDKEMYRDKYYGLLPLSNNAVIFAAPNGVNGSNPCSGNNAGDSGCGWPSGNNNMELMDAVAKQVTDNFCVDMNHIYATGWSYGASMSYEVGCERPLGGTKATWGVRAIAIYSGAQMSGRCSPSIPIGFYESHGTHDSVLNYSGGVTLAQNVAKANGCTWATPTSVSSGAHVCTKEAGCKDGYPVEFCSFNGDHTPYPDSGSSSNSWGPQEVWTFFSQF